jgi:D-lactate dehydrogenase
VSAAPSDLRRLFPAGVVLEGAVERAARAVDASIYRMVPRSVVRPRDVDDVRRLFAHATGHGRRLTFRGAGTSLSGQAVGDDIVVEIGAAWRAVQVLDEGRRVRVQPGAIGGHVNRRLAAHGRRLGPDPASIDAATVGGILANNASGMCCGIAQNSYRTLESAAVLLADGVLVDTARPDADARFAEARPALHAGLASLRDRARRDPEVVTRIRTVFSLKNTTGYMLAALLDHDAPAEILARLMVGSQGTLGFVAEATLRTVEDPAARATALLLFEDLEAAGRAVPVLGAAGAYAVEIMDAAALRAQPREERPGRIGDRRAALLVELADADAGALRERVRGLEEALSSLGVAGDARFTTNPAERERMWHLRKGLFPAIGGGRPPGTAIVIEDVAVPVLRLASAIRDLQQLFARHALSGTAIFGHAKDGNLHFVLAEDFARPGAVERYAAFMRDLVDLVLGRYGGALKAEHGSGRNMAPFVRAQWGDACYTLMRDIKRLLDPHGILNPGVLISDDPEAHLRHLKTLPAVSPLVDACIECGFCEPRCPSRDLTLTPRQRIAVLREMARPGAREWTDALERDYSYAGVETCVGDGMCQTSCPVHIDTGQAMKVRRAERRSAWRTRAAALLAERVGLVLGAGRAALRLAAFARRVPGLQTLLPEGPLPLPASPLPVLRAAGAHDVVYFPSCLTRLLGRLPGEASPEVASVVVEALEAAGYRVRRPEGAAGLCCGLLFESKGYAAAGEHARRRAASHLARASDDGRLPIVTDASPCAQALAAVAPVLDFPSFFVRELLPRRPALRRRPGRAVLHPVCSLRRQNGVADLRALGEACAEEVRVPLSAECCGFAGDRGFFVPEVTAAAMREEAAEIRSLLTPGAALYSTSRTCELGLARALDTPCHSVVHLVREALRGR